MGVCLLLRWTRCGIVCDGCRPLGLLLQLPSGCCRLRLALLLRDAGCLRSPIRLGDSSFLSRFTQSRLLGFAGGSFTVVALLAFGLLLLTCRFFLLLPFPKPVGFCLASLPCGAALGVAARRPLQNLGIGILDMKVREQGGKAVGVVGPEIDALVALESQRDDTVLVEDGDDDLPGFEREGNLISHVVGPRGRWR